ncbi:phage protease [Tritonibacter sp. SIMBA_163]|uniref:phage protease n=1 Tax=Tritonibacter sp. SIMBA_163 TaxID=3080868 RepID=UPI003980460F
MLNEASATCELSGKAPDWVHLFPSGQMVGRDGRRFALSDPKSVIQAFQQSGVDLPIDYKHQNDRKPDGHVGPVPAAGWIKELKADAAGLWGRVEWTAQSRELIATKAYRYLSPSVFFEPGSKAITKLKGAGLVHNPNLQLRALASQDTAMPDSQNFMQQLAQALYLPAEAEPQAVFEAIATLKGEARAETAAQFHDPARFVPIEAVQELMQDRNQQLSTQAESRIAGKVSDAVSNGIILPRMKEWATALCHKDEAAFDTYVSNSIPGACAYLINSTPLPSYPDNDIGQSTSSSQEAAAICAQLGLSPDALND